MAPFTVIYCLRSDGKTQVVLPNGKTEANSPTEQQLKKVESLDKKTGVRVYDYYKELTKQDSKFKVWLVKLASMYIHAQGTEAQKAELRERRSGFIFAAFPEGYRLYEHIKTRVDPADKAQKKTHAGGGNDRQDAYLYGYPGGREKRFRSPADFWPHMSHLLDGNATCHKDCACRFCAPDEIQPLRDSSVPIKRGPSAGAPRASAPKHIKPKISQDIQVVVPYKPLEPQPPSRLQAIKPNPQHPQFSIAPAPSQMSVAGPQQAQFINTFSSNNSNAAAPRALPQKVKPAVQPQWVAAPAHPSHLDANLDGKTIAWMEKNSPGEYQMWHTWKGGNFASEREKDELHRALIGRLDYLVWQGAKIPMYHPRQESMLSKTGRLLKKFAPKPQYPPPPRLEAAIPQETQPFNMDQQLPQYDMSDFMNIKQEAQP